MLKRALTEARDMGSSYVSTGHVLLAALGPLKDLTRKNHRGSHVDVNRVIRAVRADPNDEIEDDARGTPWIVPPALIDSVMGAFLSRSCVLRRGLLACSRALIPACHYRRRDPQRHRRATKPECIILHGFHASAPDGILSAGWRAVLTRRWAAAHPAPSVAGPGGVDIIHGAQLE